VADDAEFRKHGQCRLKSANESGAAQGDASFVVAAGDGDIDAFFDAQVTHLDGVVQEDGANAEQDANQRGIHIF
jgi:hypothetical protein